MGHGVKKMMLLCMGTHEDSDGLRESDDGGVAWIGKLAARRGFHTAVVRGVGTRAGVVGWVAGGVSGAGAKDRALDLVAHIEIQRPDEIYGACWSRGVLVMHLAAQILDRLGKKITAVAAMDTVTQRGVPFIGSDGVGRRWPSNVGQVYHAMAAGENGLIFPLRRWKGAQEVWFPGRHGDIGGTPSVLSGQAPVWLAHRIGLDPDEADPEDGSSVARPDALCRRRRKHLRPGDRILQKKQAPLAHSPTR